MADRRTSDTHPIYVSWLPTRGPGRVGLTLAPGKQQQSAHPGANWRRDLAADLDRLRSAERVDALVSLLEPGEYRALGIAGYHDEVRRRGIDLLELAVRDGCVPTDPRAAARLVAAIEAKAQAGERVVIHCAGGLGRSGVIGGCFLVAQGMSADEALAALREHRSGRCPETSDQAAFIRRFAASREAQRWWATSRS